MDKEEATAGGRRWVAACAISEQPFDEAKQRIKKIKQNTKIRRRRRANIEEAGEAKKPMK